MGIDISLLPPGSPSHEKDRPDEEHDYPFFSRNHAHSLVQQWLEQATVLNDQGFLLLGSM